MGTAAGGTARATINPVLNVAVDNTDVDYSDPGLAYSVLGWQMEQETCDTLVGYSDHSGTKVSSSISPLGAAAMPVIKNGGKVYIFTIRSGLRFSNGDPVTAANYKYAFDRDALHNLNSPVTAFTGFIKGWNTENNSSSESVRSVSGVIARGQKLKIVLTHPDGALLPKLAMPFFCPLDKNSAFWNGSQWKDSEYAGAYPGNGPYYLYSRNVGSQMVLKKNPYYKGVKRSRASTIVVNMNLATNTAYDGITNGTYASDLNGNPEPANNYTLYKTYGLNKSRFWVEKTYIIAYLVMNQARKAFGPTKSAKVRQAVNYVIDRPGLLKIAGYKSGKAQTQALPQQLAGKYFRAKWAYPISTPTNKRFRYAKKLSASCKHGKHINFWHGSSAPALVAANLDSHDLTKMGCVVNSVSYTGYGRYVAAGVKGTNMDIMTAGWSDDYPDGYDWFGILFNGRTITSSNNNDLAYMNSKAINVGTNKCNAKVGTTARNNCWGALDQYMTKNIAPWATENAANFVDYISGNAHGYVYDNPWASADLGLLYQS